MTGQIVRVARTGDLPEGEARSLTIGEARIVLCRIGGEFSAFKDACTHDASPFNTDRIEGQVIECPRHGARFDVRTGEALRLPAVAPLRMLPVKVVGDEVFLTLEE